MFYQESFAQSGNESIANRSLDERYVQVRRPTCGVAAAELDCGVIDTEDPAAPQSHVSCRLDVDNGRRARPGHRLIDYPVTRIEADLWEFIESPSQSSLHVDKRTQRMPKGSLPSVTPTA